MKKHVVENDQYYTNPDVAKKCVDMVDMTEFDRVIEPSAGRGDFFKLLPSGKTVAVDIEPKMDGIIGADFFRLDVGRLSEDKVLTIGNPPFGKNASLAYAFFERAAEYSECIAFILPRTFRKPSMINRLNRSFHLEQEVLLDGDSFYIEVGEGLENYSVPCVFQVWRKLGEQREITVQACEHEDFSFLEKPMDYTYSNAVIKFGVSDYYDHETEFSYEVPLAEYKIIGRLRKEYPKLFRPHTTKQIDREVDWITTPDFVLRRAGAQAGKSSTAYHSASMEGNEFITCHVDGVRETFQKLWETVWDPHVDIDKKNSKYDTAGTPSISRGDIVYEYKKIKGETV